MEDSGVHMQVGNPEEGILSVEAHDMAMPPVIPMWKLVMVVAIAVGMQFGWALQSSHLFPYIYLLGIDGSWSSIWVSGPLSGIIVLPLVSRYSDRCTSRYGRRRPFIAGGTTLVAIVVVLIGFVADIGHSFGDHIGNNVRARSVCVFVAAYLIFDVGHNMLQGACRSLLADLSSGNHKRMRTANALFSFFMAIGDILGYAVGSCEHIHKLFPFSSTKACDIDFANLKTCLLISSSLLVTITVTSLITVKEKVYTSEEVIDGVDDEGVTSNGSSKFGALINRPRAMWIILLATCLNWMALFLFLLRGTDWLEDDV